MIGAPGSPGSNGVVVSGGVVGSVGVVVTVGVVDSVGGLLSVGVVVLVGVVVAVGVGSGGVVETLVPAAADGPVPTWSAADVAVARSGVVPRRPDGDVWDDGDDVTPALEPATAVHPSPTAESVGPGADVLLVAVATEAFVGVS